MTNEESITIIENEIQIDVRLCTDEQVDKFQKALYKAIEALRSKPCGEPLTLEQLREMINEPVYLYIYDTALDSGWHIIKAVTEDKIIFRGWNTVYVPISSLGKCFDLYAYPPAHIDREAWEPCADCKSCVSCEFSMIPYGEKPCTLCRRKSKFKPRNFCNSCGRPLTEEAWAILEKRLRG